MYDRVETIGRSVIQHGKHNDRVYLMKLSASDFPGIIARIEAMAGKEGYGKIFAKLPGWTQKELILRGYKIEATVPFFYNTVDSAVFFARFIDPARGTMERKTRDRITGIIENACSLVFDDKEKFECHSNDVTLLDKTHAPALSYLYRSVFASYPFPVFDPDYVAQSMDTGTLYFGIFDGDRLVAAAGADMDLSNLNAEMTDFAVLPEYRGRRFSSVLLTAMEKEVQKRGFNVCYTIARAMQPGINIAFARGGYLFAGTLVNNTGIAGRIESMNVWYRIGF
ncbi:MAG: putative beta-lysine N-acetyltransferase [Desulfarculaceae bacterium]|nr:putative beta-lysine N-acetyltransferase [Desulfarculaceae bacterium]